jgi:two-component system, LytTR family, response regulator
MNLPLTQKAGNSHVIINQRLSKTLPIADIVLCEGCVNYTIIYMNNGRKIVSSRTLKSFENTLFESGFTRIHRAYLINYQHYSSFDKDNGLVLMKNGVELNVSRRRLNAFRDTLIRNA